MTHQKLRRALGGDSSASLDVVVNKTRLDDHVVGAKVVAVLTELGLPVRLVDVDALEFALRRDRGRGDMFIDHVMVAPTEPMSAVLERDDSTWLRRVWAKQDVTNARVRSRVDASAKIAVLYKRSQRVHHWASVRGVEFVGVGTLNWGSVFSVGRPVMAK